MTKDDSNLRCELENLYWAKRGGNDNCLKCDFMFNHSSCLFFLTDTTIN